RHLVRSKPDRAIGRDSAQLTVQCCERNSGTKRERDEASHCFSVCHHGPASLAQAYEYFERLADLVFGDVHEHRAERSFLADGGTAQHFRTRALCTTLQSLGLALVQRLAGTLELSGKLGDGALQFAYLALERCVGQRRSLSTLGLCLFRSARGENLAIARAVAVHRDALAVQGVRQFVDLLHVFACG